MLSFDEFQNFIKNKFAKAMPDADIKEKTSLKNNGIVMHGLAISYPGSNISPCIYLDEVFGEYKSGRSLESITESILNTAQESINTPDEFKNIQNDFMNFEKIQDKIIMVAINSEKNQELLSQVPHTPKEDLALIYKIALKDGSSEQLGTITIRNEHLTKWGKTLDDLHNKAVENTPKLLPPQINTMNDLMKEMAKNNGFPDEIAKLMVSDIPEQMQMYIISNKSRVNGAATMFYDGVLSSMSDKLGTDLYVLPSSVHEVIVISTQAGEPDDLQEMVQEINNSEVAPEERLSDSVYKFDSKVKELSIVAEPPQRIYRKSR